MKSGDNDRVINWIISIFLTIVVLLSCYNPVKGQSGFPFAYGDQVVYYPKLAGKTQDMEVIKAGLSAALKKLGQFYDVSVQKTFDSKDIKSILVHNNGIEIDVKGQRSNLNWLFSAIDDSTMLFFGKQNAGNYIFMPGVANLAFAEFDAAQQFANNIYAIQYPSINRIRDSVMAVFKEKLKAYKGLNKEDTVAEAQKALFLAADSASRMMDYMEAIRIYLRAIQMDELSYPKAYANLALLYAHINFFDYAILYIDKYLLLNPGPEEERNARDKRYEWEGLIYY